MNSIKNSFSPKNQIGEEIITKTKKQWPVYGKVLVVAKIFFQFINSYVSRSKNLSRQFGPEMKKTISVLSFGSPIGVAIDAASLSGQTSALGQAIAHQDHVSSLITSTGIAMTVTDIVDSIGTFIGAITDIANKPSIAFFSAVAMPIGFFLTTAGIITRSYKVYEGASSRYDIDHLLQSCKDEALSPEQFTQNLSLFLKKHVGLTDEESQKVIGVSSFQTEDVSESQQKALNSILAAKRSCLKRGSGKQVLEALRALYEEVQSDQPMTEKRVREIMQQIKNIQKTMDRELDYHFWNIIANVITFIALIMFVTSFSSGVPFLFLLAAACIRLGIVIYSKQQPPLYAKT